MIRAIGAALIALLCAIGAAHAEDAYGIDHFPVVGKMVSHARHVVQRDPRPRAWCGWWLRHHLGVVDRSYNLARRWASYGTPAHGPAPGVIAVWRHHVGIVTGVPAPGRIVLKSGNDGHAVRERERSSRGVIAWRWPGGMAGL